MGQVDCKPNKKYKLYIVAGLEYVCLVCVYAVSASHGARTPRAALLTN